MERTILDLVYSNAKMEKKERCGRHAIIKELLAYYKEVPDRPRFLYDGDAVFFYNVDKYISQITNDVERRFVAERGDIMMSFWMPFTFFLHLNRDRIIAKNNENVDMLISRIEQSEREESQDIEIEDACELFDNLVNNYFTRGNMLLLPNTMNESGIRRFNPDRGCLTQDKIDQTLWHCFEGGKFHSYFKNDNNNVVEWVKSEHLECMFSEEFFLYELSDIIQGKVDINISGCDIKVENVQCLVPGKSIEDYNFNSLTNEEWKIFCHRIDKVISYRNGFEFVSHAPYEWN